MRRIGRLPWPAPDELEPDQRALHEVLVGADWSTGDSAVSVADGDGRLLGPFNAMVLSPAIGGRVSDLGAALRHRSSLTGRERELAILAVAVAERSDYEWEGHRRPGLAEGLSHDELRVLVGGTPPDTLTERERCVHRVATLLIRHRDLSDEEFHGAVTALGHVAVVELLWLAGYYALIAMSLRVARVPLPDGISARFSTTPGGARGSGRPAKE